MGPYTAAAVGSIAFGIGRAVVDGNVLRVISRLTADASDIGAPATKERFESVAGALLDRRDPGRFNQAMMELGATICLPRDPLCLLCPVSSDCKARIEGKQAQLPVKLKRIEPDSNRDHAAGGRAGGKDSALAERSRVTAAGRILGIAVGGGFAQSDAAGDGGLVPALDHQSQLHVHGNESECRAGVESLSMVRTIGVETTALEHHDPQGNGLAATVRILTT